MVEQTLSEINQFFNEVRPHPKLKLVDGEFGKLSVIQHVPTQKLFVKKVVPLNKFSEMEPMVHNLMKHSDYFVKLYYSLQTLNAHVMIIDHVPGGDLFDLLKKYHKVGVTEARSIVGQLAEALHALHSHRIIHNDVKLENVLYSRRKFVRLCDYGLCKVIGTPSERDGTVDYFSPEKLARQPSDTHVDFWALGVLAYELLTGNHPFKRHDSEDLDADDLADRQKKRPITAVASQTAHSFVAAMLHPVLERRLCAYRHIIAHNFMKQDQF
jgi:serine/threonine protein kinase